MLSTSLSRAMGRHGLHYGWAMVAVTFLTMLSTSGAMSLPGVLIDPMRTEFRWDTSAISGPLALRLLIYGLMAPFAAALLQRYGVRRVVGAALGLIVLGLGLTTRITTLWELWLCWGVLVGVGTGLTAMVLGATIASRWFAQRRGLAMGILTASSATGQLIFLPFNAWLAQAVGWRLSVALPVAFCALAWVLMLLLGAEQPASLGLAAYGDAGPVAAPDVALGRAGGNPARVAVAALTEAAGSRTFWALFFTFFVCGLSTNGLVQTHFIALCHDFGLPEVEGASVLAAMGAFDFVGTIGSGYLSDRYDSRKLLCWYYGLRGLSLLFLPQSGFTLYGLSIFAVFYGLDWIATVPPTVRLAGGAFGRERGPVVFGWVFTAHQLGAAAAAMGGGLSRDLLGSYVPAFYAAGAACVLAALVALAARPRARAVRAAAA